MTPCLADADEQAYSPCEFGEDLAANPASSGLDRAACLVVCWLSPPCRAVTLAMCLDLQGQRGETEEEQTGNSAWSDIVPAVLHKHSNASGSEEQMQRCQMVVELALMFNHINGEESRND